MFNQIHLCLFNKTKLIRLLNRKNGRTISKTQTLFLFTHFKIFRSNNQIPLLPITKASTYFK